MTDDIVTRLEEAFLEAKHNPTSRLKNIIKEAADEIERLRADLQHSALQTNVMRNIALGPYGNAADEIERLQKELESCNQDFDALTEMFNNMRTQRDRWKSVAWLGHKVIFSKWEYTQFEQAYEEAVSDLE